MITQKPDLLDALKEFIDSEKSTRFWDKSFALPEIISARIVPILYESKYGDKI